MKNFDTTIAKIKAALADLRTRIASLIERIKTPADAADKALAKIDAGIRALEAAKEAAEVEYVKSQKAVEAHFAAHYEAYDRLAGRRNEASRKIDRAERLIRKYAA
ncbi:hypothetical protein LO749_20910 [Paracoccus denitrificans]|uniref:hypothetical protein n=1 Tax=Paracoccus denitrificans TaxID=266 RepID=UPI001E3C4890|nr:hypothetical protein [Paracoccus denitrificans]UFS66956.1 hypothetical protein LO749_20910 [Paracoccus denitrificans]